MPDFQQNQCAASVRDCQNQEAVMNNPQQKLTILYQRLSKDDPNGADGESNSVKNQRDMLEKYAKQNGFVPYRCLSDDGKTGTNFSRPGWTELMELVEADEVGTIIVKTLDRMGRNYLEAGMLREIFEDKGIRLIAIHDGVDTFDHTFKKHRGVRVKYDALSTEYESLSKQTGMLVKSKADKAKTAARDFHEEHRAELTMYATAEKYLRDVLQKRFDPTKLPVKKWRDEREACGRELAGINSEYNVLKSGVQNAETLKRFAVKLMIPDEPQERGQKTISKGIEI